MNIGWATQNRFDTLVDYAAGAVARDVRIPMDIAAELMEGGIIIDELTVECANTSVE